MLSKLGIKRLIRELDFIRSDFDYKSEIIKEVDSYFISDVNTLLDENPKLKKVFDDIDNIIIDEIIDVNESEYIKVLVDEVLVDKHINLKKLYRNIAKKTHPDKISDIILNDLYIKATLSYDDNDIIDIYSICDHINIEYDLLESDINLMEVRIKEFKDKLIFMESTFTWKWHNSDNQSDKNDILINYIKSHIIRV